MKARASRAMSVTLSGTSPGGAGDPPIVHGDDLAILGEPLGGASGIFTHDFELLDEQGRRLAPSDIPSVRTLRTVREF